MLFDTVRDLIQHYLNMQIDVNRYKIDMGTRGIKRYDSPNDIPEEELDLTPFWYNFRGYKDECGIRCRELEIYSD